MNIKGNKMKKSELRTGMLVKIEGKENLLKVTVSNIVNTDTATLEESGNNIMGWDSINDDLSSKCFSTYNIIEVYAPKNCRGILNFNLKDHKLIWAKEKVTEMTVRELEKKYNIKNLKIIGG